MGELVDLLSLLGNLLLPTVKSFLSVVKRLAGLDLGGRFLVSCLFGWLWR